MIIRTGHVFKIVEAIVEAIVGTVKILVVDLQRRRADKRFENQSVHKVAATTPKVHHKVTVGAADWLEDARNRAAKTSDSA